MVNSNNASFTYEHPPANSVVTLVFLGIGSSILGVLGLAFTWLGMRQLSDVASPTFTGQLEDYPIVALLWEGIATNPEAIDLAQVAQTVQFSLMTIGLFGIGLLIVGIVLLILAVFRRQNRKLP